MYCRIADSVWAVRSESEIQEVIGRSSGDNVRLSDDAAASEIRPLVAPCFSPSAFREAGESLASIEVP